MKGKVDLESVENKKFKFIILHLFPSQPVKKFLCSSLELCNSGLLMFPKNKECWLLFINKPEVSSK